MSSLRPSKSATGERWMLPRSEAVLSNSASSISSAACSEREGERDGSWREPDELAFFPRRTMDAKKPTFSFFGARPEKDPVLLSCSEPSLEFWRESLRDPWRELRREPPREASRREVLPVVASALLREDDLDAAVNGSALFSRELCRAFWRGGSGRVVVSARAFFLKLNSEVLRLSPWGASSFRAPDVSVTSSVLFRLLWLGETRAEEEREKSLSGARPRGDWAGERFWRSVAVRLWRSGDAVRVRLPLRDMDLERERDLDFGRESPMMPLRMMRETCARMLSSAAE
mmetsp:Transcript_7581/g.18683  ORF Transcript_7581/g.18683 Transcript_7581/m.18683 type:complete len:287 (+) Transcript_7581:270-1130(+)